MIPLYFSFCFKSWQENGKYLIWCEISWFQKAIMILYRNNLYEKFSHQIVLSFWQVYHKLLLQRNNATASGLLEWIQGLDPLWISISSMKITLIKAKVVIQYFIIKISLVSPYLMQSHLNVLSSGHFQFYSQETVTEPQKCSHKILFLYTAF